MIELLVILRQQQSAINLISKYGNDHVVVQLVPHDSRETFFGQINPEGAITSAESRSEYPPEVR